MNNKKAFTVVELVIVIAIIAILAAVLIPTFASMVRSANVSADTQLIKNLNTSLRADLPDGKHPTMHDALKAAEAFGYDVDKINASAVGNEILWDQRNDVFCYVKGDEVIYIPESVAASDKIASKGSHELWKIYNAKSGAVPAAGDQTNPQTNSIYLGPDANYSSALDNNGIFNVTVGIDVGNQPAISKINYDNATNDGQTVIIRTNSSGTELIVNAPHRTVKHYDYVGKVHIIAVDSNNCYEENGKAAFTQIDSGKYRTSETAEVELLFVSSSGVQVAVVPGTVHHAHAYDSIIAGDINASNPGVTFDYDGNSDQNDLDVHHHVADADKLKFDVNYDTNNDKDAVADAVDKLASKEVVELNKTGAKYVARIGAKYYETFNAAVTANTNNKTIVLIADCYIDENIGNSQLVGALNCIVSLDKDLTITFKNNAQVYMTDQCRFELNEHQLFVFFDQSNTKTNDSGFMNCSLAHAYYGKYQEYWEYEFDNNSRIANVYVDFYGVESYANVGLGLIYNQTQGIVLGPSAVENELYDDLKANRSYVNGVVDEDTYSLTINLGVNNYDGHPKTARIVVEPGATNYSWSVDKDEVLELEQNANMVQLTALNDPSNSANGTLITVKVTYTNKNGDEIKFEWAVTVRGPINFDDVEEF